MKVEVGKEVEVSDEAIEYVAKELAKKFPSVMYDNQSRDQREHVNHSKQIAAKAIAEYIEWREQHRTDYPGIVPR